MNKRTKAMMQTDVDIGNRVRSLRIKRGMSQEVLAEALGLTFQQVQKYEKGTNRISGSRLVDLARQLKVPVAALFGEDGRGSSVVIDTQINTVTRQQLMKWLDEIDSADIESSLRDLVMAMAKAKTQ
jgi:transcriptional regulator with XRE-family HTH domain